MIDLLPVFICPKCGEVLSDQVEDIEIIDVDRDDVWKESIHILCGHSVKRKLGEHGEPCYEHVDHEQWLWANGFYDEEFHP